MGDAIHMCGDAGGPHEYVMGTGSGAIKFSVQYFIDMGRRCSLDSITASCMVLRVCPLSSSLDESTTNELFASMIHGPLVAAVRKNCIAHPASMLDFLASVWSLCSVFEWIMLHSTCAMGVAFSVSVCFSEKMHGVNIAARFGRSTSVTSRPCVLSCHGQWRRS